MDKKKILKYGYLRYISPMILGIILGFLFKSVCIALYSIFIAQIIIMYYYIIRYNLLVGYAQLGKGSWASKASENKGWIVFYTVLILLLIIYSRFAICD